MQMLSTRQQMFSDVCPPAVHISKFVLFIIKPASLISLIRMSTSFLIIQQTAISLALQVSKCVVQCSFPTTETGVTI